MKKFLSLILALTMLLSICCPAALAEETTAVKGTALFPCDENGIPDLGGVTLKIWIPMDTSYMTFAESYDEFTIVKEMERLMNVNLEFVHPSPSDVSASFSLMLSDPKNLPDLIFTGAVDSYYPGGVTMAYADGLLADYTDLISEENTPNYWATVMSIPYLAAGAVDDEGRNIRLGCMVSGSPESCTCMWGHMIRSDYLAAAGLDVPETIDEWTEMLRAFKANGVKYPLLLNKSNYWRSRNAFSCAWNIDADGFFVRTGEDGNVTTQIDYAPATKEYQEYIKTLNMWYSEGLINPDFMTDTSNETWSMLANGDGGAITNHTVGYTSNYYNVVEKQNPEAALVAAQMPKLNKDDDLTNVMYTSYRLDIGNARYIVSTTEHLNECVAFLDALHNPTINFLNTYGIEGLSFEYNEYGYPQYLEVDETNLEQQLAQYIWNLDGTSDSDKEYIKTSKYCNGVQPQTIDLYTQCGYDGIFPDFAVTFSDEESEIIARYETDVATYRDEMMLKFITGQESLDDDNFAKYVETLNKFGLDKLMEVYQTAYDRYLVRAASLLGE